MSYSLQQIAKKLSLTAVGDCELESVAAIDLATNADITFVNKKAYLSQLKSTKASAVIIKPEWQDECSLPCLLSDDPYFTNAQVTALLYPDVYTKTPVIASNTTIDNSAVIPSSCALSANVVIGKNVVLGENCYLAPGVVISDGVKIGANARIHPNVVIMHDCIIGDNAVIHAGAVIGADGFGFAPKDKIWHKIPQVGRVVIHNNVEIGANTTIDRGANRDTIIEDGVKLDNLIQVAHNVHIGAHTAIAAKVGIAGSAKIGQYCTIGGAAVVLGHLEIVDGVHINACSLVTNSISEAGQYASGTPLEPVASWRKNRARFKQLDGMAKTLKKLLKD